MNIVKIVIRVVLGMLCLASTFLAIGGIWGLIPGDIAWQLFAIAIVLSFAIIGFSKVFEQFL